MKKIYTSLYPSNRGAVSGLIWWLATNLKAEMLLSQTPFIVNTNHPLQPMSLLDKSSGNF